MRGGNKELADTTGCFQFHNCVSESPSRQLSRVKLLPLHLATTAPPVIVGVAPGEIPV